MVLRGCGLLLAPRQLLDDRLEQETSEEGLFIKLLGEDI